MLLVVFIFPQVAKLLGFLLQIYEELHVCILEQACWCRCRVPLQGAAAGCCLKVNGVGALEWHAGKMWSTKK